MHIFRGAEQKAANRMLVKHATSCLEDSQALNSCDQLQQNMRGSLWIIVSLSQNKIPS